MLHRLADHPLYFICCCVRYLQEWKQDIGASYELEVIAMFLYLLTGALLGRAGLRVLTFAAGVGWKTPGAVR